MHATTAEQYGMLSQFVAKSQTALPAVPAPNGSTTPYRVLIMEASVALGRLLATGLRADNLSVQVTHDPVSGREQFNKRESDLLIVDLDMAGAERIGLLSSLRSEQPGVRILVLSARTSIEEMVSALDNGADDYLQKPFSLLELMARVRALKRRGTELKASSVPKGPALVLHHDQCRVERDGRFIDLTPREFTLLEYLMQHPGRTVSRAVLTEKVWNATAEGSTNIVDVYIKYLRDKLDAEHDVKLIRTVRGVGYSYQA